MGSEDWPPVYKLLDDRLAAFERVTRAAWREVTLPGDADRAEIARVMLELCQALEALPEYRDA